MALAMVVLIWDKNGKCKTSYVALCGARKMERRDSLGELKYHRFIVSNRCGRAKT